MERADEDGSARATVLLLGQDHPTGRSLLAALAGAPVSVEWVKTRSELRSRLDRADLPRPALVMVLPSRQGGLSPLELAGVALQLAAVAGEPPTLTTTPALGPLLDIYCAMRALSALSRRQRQVLELYLIGNNDKEIADSFRCSSTTVYEHWRRMAKKASGAHKSDVVTDFHRFLAARSSAVTRSSPAAPTPGSPEPPPAP
jgi:DNA-binding CsgD family transcriptional regulator